MSIDNSRKLHIEFGHCMSHQDIVVFLHDLRVGGWGLEIRVDFEMDLDHLIVSLTFHSWVVYKIVFNKFTKLLS